MSKKALKIIILGIIAGIFTINSYAIEIFAKNTKHVSISADLSGKYKIGFAYEINYSSMLGFNLEYDSYSENTSTLKIDYKFYKADVVYNYLLFGGKHLYMNIGAGMFYENALYNDENNISVTKNGYGPKSNIRLDYKIPINTGLSIFVQDDIRYYIKNTFYEGIKNDVLVGISYHY